MQISLAKLRKEMFKLLPHLKDDEELTITSEARLYILSKKRTMTGMQGFCRL
jgi:hypothetical protein